MSKFIKVKDDKSRNWLINVDHITSVTECGGGISIWVIGDAGVIYLRNIDIDEFEQMINSADRTIS